jgi:PAS domain S-box-containing protein
VSTERSLAVADLHALFDEASFGVVAISAEGTVVYVNPRQCENSRLSPEALLGEDYRRTFGATMERSGLLPLYDRLVEEGVPFEATLLDYKRHVDGMSIAFTMRGHRAGPWLLLTTVVERTLAGRQARYLQLFENANDGIFILSREGKFLEANRRYAEIVGIPVEKLIGQTTEIVMPGRFAESLGRVERVIREGRLGPYETEITTPKGVRHLSLNAVALLDEGKPVGVINIVRDVTEAVMAREQQRQAEERLRRLVDTLPIAVIESLADGTILSANPAASRLLGFDGPDELLATNARSLWLDPAERERLLLTYSPAEPVHEYERRIRRRDGHVVWVHGRTRALFDDEGGLVRLESAWEDITERREAEDELKHSEERFRMLAALAPVSIFQTDAAGRGVYTNERWQQLTGLTAEQGRGEGWIAAVHPEDRGRLVTLWQQCVRERRSSFDAEFRFQTPRGEVRWVRATARPIRTRDGEVLGYIGAKHDVSEQKAIEQMRSDFVAMLTHDLKNPLATVLGFAELLEEPRRRDRPAILRSLQAAATRALGIANNFLDYTQIESGTLELRPEAAQLNLIVDDVVDFQGPAAKARGVSLETLLANDLPELMLDESLFGRALTNLVSNAIKFSPQGGRVTVETAHRGGGVVVTVRDRGPGIAPADRGKLFQRFGLHSKLGKTGTGLGLFIVKSVVDAHGGEVDLECPAEGGAVFRISLPLAKPSA